MLTRQPNSGEAPKVIIVGGGITGLSAAFYLERAARAAGRQLSCTLVERERRFGGKILTELVEDQAGAFVVEGGPDSFVTQKPWAAQLARDLGLAERLAGTLPARRSTYILRGGRPCPLPEGMALIFPTELLPFLRSPLLSWRGKLAMARDLWLPRRRDGGDETLADFIRRRFGAEALDRLAEPLLAGIHSCDPERQSMQMTFPRFQALEQQHGSIIRAMRAARRKSQGQPKPAGAESPFATLSGGVGELTEALIEQIEGQLISGRAVAELSYDADGERAYCVRLDDGELLAADAVIVTTPASAAAELLAPFGPELAAQLRDIRSVTTATISLAYRSAEIGAPLDGYGLLIPQSERREINALTMTSQKFAGRAPHGTTLIRVFAGGARTPATVALGDEQLLALVRRELRELLGIAAAPLWGRIYRWPDGNPQYDLGHAERVAQIARRLPAGMLLAGCSYGGVGLPDCVRQGQAAALQALATIDQRTGAAVAL